MKADQLALLCMDFQNDRLHPEGVCAKNGISCMPVDSVVRATIEVMKRCREVRIPIIGCYLTVLPDLSGRGIGIDLLKKGLPFLVKEGFRIGTWGHAFLDGLLKPDYSVCKWSYSSMFRTELEHILCALSVKTLVLTGYSTNGVVEATARNAVERGFEIVTLSDCTTGGSPQAYEASLNNLRTYGSVLTSQEFLSQLKSA